MEGVRLILASASPRRRELLGLLGIPFEICPPKVDELPREDELPHALAVRLASDKARAVASANPDAVVIGADTVVAMKTRDGFELFAKPEDVADARRMLSALSGKEHIVVTGFSVQSAGGESNSSAAIETVVSFRPLEHIEIDAYISTGEPMDKAGAYGIQGAGGVFVDRINGSYSNVVGLPICEVCLALKDTGLFPKMPLRAG